MCYLENFLPDYMLCNNYCLLSSDPPSTNAVAMVTVNQTDPASFNCFSFGIPPPTISWYSSHAPDTPIVTSEVITVEYSNYVNDSSLQIQTSMLSISQTSRSLHEANYTCVATNGVENFIGTSEQAITELIVQGDTKQDVVCIDLVVHVCTLFISMVS